MPTRIRGSVNNNKPTKYDGHLKHARATDSNARVIVNRAEESRKVHTRIDIRTAQLLKADIIDNIGFKLSCNEKNQLENEK
uniref:Uncharacterized protein n=1 Tax=Syphacia muris TaxID=451379 RepID=A0A0N5AYH6_9BILA